MGTIVWFIIALVLACLELAAGELTFLMLACGALAGAGASLLGAPEWANVAVFAVAALGLVVFLRPALRRRMHQPLALDTSPQALVGATATVLEPITPAGGQVRVNGDIWSAKPVDFTTEFAVGERVMVVRIDGATAVVWKEI